MFLVSAPSFFLKRRSDVRGDFKQRKGCGLKGCMQPIVSLVKLVVKMQHLETFEVKAVCKSYSPSRGCGLAYDLWC